MRFHQGFAPVINEVVGEYFFSPIVFHQSQTHSTYRHRTCGKQRRSSKRNSCTRLRFIPNHQLPCAMPYRFKYAVDRNDQPWCFNEAIGILMHDLEAKACFHCETLARHFECTSHVDPFKGLEAACQARDRHLQSKLMSTLDALEKELQEGLEEVASLELELETLQRQAPKKRPPPSESLDSRPRKLPRLASTSSIP